MSRSSDETTIPVRKVLAPERTTRIAPNAAEIIGLPMARPRQHDIERRHSLDDFADSGRPLIARPLDTPRDIPQRYQSARVGGKPLGPLTRFINSV